MFQKNFITVFPRNYYLKNCACNYMNMTMIVCKKIYFFNEALHKI